MKRQRRRRTRRRSLLRGGLAAAAALLLALGVRQTAPLLAPMLQQTALCAAMLTVPDRTAALLERRFAGDLALPAPTATAAPPAAVPPTELPAASPLPTPSSTAPPIPAEYRGEILEADLSAQGDERYLPIGRGFLNNYTELTDGEILALLEIPADLVLEDTGEPLVLIMHTHTTEGYEPYDSAYYDTRNTWRTTDNACNVAAVGAVLADTLRQAGIPTLHDSTQHDYPSYNGSYERSAETVQRYLQRYPSIRVVIDLHRDATERDGALLKPVTTVDGQKAAQLMIIAGCDDGSGTLTHWEENLRFAALLQDRLEGRWPTLMRPLFFAYRNYNQELSAGSLLFEFGAHGNTLEECRTTARLVGEELAALFLERMS